jgi:hypothetical protein
MIQKGTDTATQWAKQRRLHLTINKLKRIYRKLSYITGKRSDKTPSNASQWPDRNRARS